MPVPVAELQADVAAVGREQRCAYRFAVADCQSCGTVMIGGHLKGGVVRSIGAYKPRPSCGAQPCYEPQSVLLIEQLQARRVAVSKSEDRSHTTRAIDELEAARTERLCAWTNRRRSSPAVPFHDQRRQVVEDGGVILRESQCGLVLQQTSKQAIGSAAATAARTRPLRPRLPAPT